jgi:hypothetical protein
MKELSTAVALPEKSSGHLLIPLGVVALVSLQILDGLLTYLGVSALGTKFEGNPLLKLGMEIIGLEVTVALAKSFAISCALLFLILPQTRVSVISVWGLNIFYFFFAVLPWSVVLLSL